MLEQWKSVVGFEGLYEVSNKGRVRSLNKFKARVLKQSFNAAGYRTLTLSAHNVIYKRYVHRLVLEAFVGPCPKGMESRHLDGNPANNTRGNLIWGTKLENRNDIVRHGRLLKGDRHPGVKLTAAEVLAIRQSKQRGLAQIYGVSRSQIMRIKKGRSWRHI